jgi:pimeloyl-ACP methyl ester carboxylesterase
MTTSTLQHVTSKDGTTIAFERTGDGAPIVLVCGGSTARGSNVGLAAELAKDFRVYNYDRRGRGDSDDTLPYAIEREIEDIEAVIDAAGGNAALYGSSSGAALALLAAAAIGDKITKLVLWEPPYILDPNARPPADQVETYERLVAENRRGDAVEYFMAKVVGMPREFVAMSRSQPWWAGTEAIAHTLAYDARIMGDYSLPVDEAASVQVPTMVVTGSTSFPFMRSTAAALAEALPNGEMRAIEGQGHDVSPQALAPVMKAFLDA